VRDLKKTKPQVRTDAIGIAMFVISSNFIGNFKLGDNINHNLEILALLYRQYKVADKYDKRLLCKPIILLIVSIIEAVLHDLHFRIRKHTFEGVRNVTETVADYVRQLRRVDELEKYIVSAKKHDFFDAADSKFYESMDELRRLRNRIHIQNTKNDFEPDEFKAFTESRKKQAERVCEKTLKTMATKFTRGAEYGYVGDFNVPWTEHFPS
jgi:hypothetical protein